MMGEEPRVIPTFWMMFSAAVSAAVAPCGDEAPQSTQQVSVNSTGSSGNLASYDPFITPDGRFITFRSAASNLVPRDLNGKEDVFVRDLVTRQTSRVSVSTQGAECDSDCAYPSLSANGRFVVFQSDATNLVSGDSNGVVDVFVHDRVTGVTTRESVNSSGGQANAFSNWAAISGDGRFLAFRSAADNLVAGDHNGVADAFLRDRLTGVTTRVSVSSLGVEGDAPSYEVSISADGSFVAFYSEAANLVPGDTNGWPDVFVHERITGLCERVSVNSAGAQSDGWSMVASISADGRRVVFQSGATNLVNGDTNVAPDVFLRDRLTGTTELVSMSTASLQGDAASYNAAISPDGRYVAFDSSASNLVAGDTNHARDIFLRDCTSGRTTRVSLTAAGAQAPGDSKVPAVSADGRAVAFASYVSLVPGDLNGMKDIYLREQSAVGPQLSAVGNCPGALTLSVQAATPSGAIAFLHGAPGVFVRAAPPCFGMTLALATPVLAAVRIADGGGSASLSFQPSASACGRSVQAVDLAACLPSNPVVL